MKTEEVSSQNIIANEKIEEHDICSNPIFGEFDPDEFEVLDEVGEEDDNPVESKDCNALDTCSISLSLNENSKSCLDQDDKPSNDIKQAANNKNAVKFVTSDIEKNHQTCKEDIKEAVRAESPLKGSTTAEVEIETCMENNVKIPLGKMAFILRRCLVIYQ